MKTHSIGLLLSLAPAVMFAQSGVQSQSTATATAKMPEASAAARANTTTKMDFRAPKSFSAEGSAKLEAMYAEASEHKVPREPIARRVAEGEAKGASETAILASAGRVKTNLEATNDAMVSAGRTHPTDAECERGASAMERGVTKAQIAAIAKSSPGDRSLVVAFDVLTKLAANGVPVAQAVARVQSNLGSGASDAAIAALVTSSAHAGTHTNGTVTGAVTGTATTTPKGVGAGVSGVVGGVVHKP